MTGLDHDKTRDDLQKVDIYRGIKFELVPLILLILVSLIVVNRGQSWSNPVNRGLILVNLGIEQTVIF